MAIDPSIISAGIGAVGSLFGGGGSKDEWVTPDYADIRKKAEAAGFNPLTALSMNAGGVGTSTHSSFGQRVADAALGVSEGIAQAQDYSLQKTALEQREREIAIKEKAVENLARQSRVSTGIGQRQVASTDATKVGGVSSQAKDNNAEKVTGLREEPNGDLIAASSVDGFDLIGQGFWRNNQYYPTGEQFEEQYGDTPLSWPYAALKFTADAVATGDYWVRKGLSKFGGTTDKSLSQLAPHAAADNPFGY